MIKYSYNNNNIMLYYNLKSMYIFNILIILVIIMIYVSIVSIMALFLIFALINIINQSIIITI